MKRVEDKKENYLKELARDFLALGSLPFLALVLARVWMLDKPDYFLQFVSASVVFFILVFIFKSELYSGLALIIGVFTSLYYQDLQFTIFAGVAYVCLVASLFYLGKEKWKIVRGVLAGAISIGGALLLIRDVFGQ